MYTIIRKNFCYVYQSLQELKDSVFLNAFIMSRIDFFHEFSTLPIVNYHSKNPDCKNHMPNEDTKKNRVFDVNQALNEEDTHEGDYCSFCYHFIDDYCYP